MIEGEVSVWPKLCLVEETARQPVRPLSVIMEAPGCIDPVFFFTAIDQRFMALDRSVMSVGSPDEPGKVV